MHASSSFAPKLLVRNVYACDIVEWETQDKATFDWDGKLRFNRVWLQGYVKQPHPGGNFTLDDGTGSIQIAPTALPREATPPQLSTGDYAVVIGRLLPGDPAAPSPDQYSVKANKVRVLTTPGAGAAWRREVEAMHRQVYDTSTA